MKVLLVEDEPKLARAIRSGLEQEGYVVETTDNGEDALTICEYQDFDVLILDRMLAGQLDGVAVCETLRTKKNPTPILMLTALNEISDRVEGLNQGADDYLGKPFDFVELIARLRALTRRPKEQVGPVVSLGELKVNTTTKDVTISGENVKLSKKEFALLEYLVLNPGVTVSKDQIIEKVWDFDSDILPNTVEATIKNIRKKLQTKNGKSNVIETVRGYGYKIAKESNV